MEIEIDNGGDNRRYVVDVLIEPQSTRSFSVKILSSDSNLSSWKIISAKGYAN